VYIKCKQENINEKITNPAIKWHKLWKT
jgi:hypothetical protein